MKPKAYSYIRFSSEKQKEGHSLERQIEAARSYAEKNGLSLDTKLTYRDLGMSGFKGRNRAEGNLKLFIDAVDNGLIKKGSYLLIESLDRLSRQKILKALNLLTEILEKGIIVVTLIDEKEYTEESINEPMHLMYSILVMGTAHEESSKKSDRIGKAWKKKRQDARDFQKPMTKKMPTWLEIKDEKIVLISARAAIVKKMFAMYLSGKGKMAITKHLNANRVKNWNGGKIWQISYVQKILSNKAAYGFLENKKKNLFVENYYPAVITKAKFLKVQNIRTNNKIPIGRAGNTVSNLFVGMCKCSSCGSTMHYVNKSSKNKPHTQNWRYLVCSMAKVGSKDCSYVGWQYQMLEKHILYSLREMDFDNLFKQDTGKDFDGEVLLKEDELKEIIKKIDNIVGVIAGTGSKALLDKLNEFEEAKVGLESEIQTLKDEQIIEQERINKPDIELIDSFFKNKDNIDLRLKIHQMLKNLISKITLIPQKEYWGNDFLFGTISIHFVANPKIGRLISVINKNQDVSISVSSDDKKGFDTRIKIEKSGKVIREEISSNEWLEYFDDSKTFNPPEEKHIIKEIKGMKFIVYPDRYKKFKADGLYSVKSE